PRGHLVLLRTLGEVDKLAAGLCKTGLAGVCRLQKPVFAGQQVTAGSCFDID
ncbi:MAG: hypothetical protein JWM45_31, partial [Pseudonocardiales bacterium]|nr:hypothetical protein [Pseudonocardiales bacterium]